MKQYPKYKDSGIQWIGQIPEEWEITRGKNMMSQITLKSDSSVKVALENIESERGKFIATESTFDGNGIAFRKGDILYGKLRPYLKKVWLAEFDGNAVGDFFVYRNEANSIPAFIKYLLLSDSFTKIANESTNGAKMPRVSNDFVLKLQFPLPPISEQESIVRYLDDKTAKIDETVNLLEQQKADLQQYRKALISQTVTRGLNPNAKLKDSGVDWIGQIPEDWRTMSVKNIFNISRGRVIATTELKENGMYPVYSSQTKNNGCMGYIDTFDYDGELITWTTDGANAGTVFHRTGRFNCTNVCGILEAKGPNIAMRYFAYLLDVVTKFYKRADTNGYKIMSNEMAQIAILLPPLSEQQEIADYLDTKTAKIDEAIKRIDEQIADLRAYRSALISDVVTGKIDVRI